MKTLLVACTLLTGCALTGLEGPERQAQAQQALRDFPGQLNRALEPGGSGDNTSAQLDEIRRQNEEASWDQLEEQQALRRIEWNQHQHQLQGNLAP